MIVTIHQPNLFPWLGFFDKMAHSDLFILLDNVPFRKRSYQNRVAIKAPNGTQWLTLPVETKGRFAQLTNTVNISKTIPWQKDHLKMLKLFYGKSANFDRVFPFLEKLYGHSDYQLLSDFTIPGILLIRDLLNIKTPIITASELNSNGKGSELLSDLVKAAGGTIYLSGPSGRNYLDHGIFQRKGIEVDYHHFEMRPYPQRFGEFIGGMSSLDYLFNVPQAAKQIGATTR
jgi:hypothetical protein